MRKLLAIFILIATLVGCNKQQEGLDVIVDGPVPTPISVAIDDTRAAGVDSAKSVFENGILGRDNVTMRYILQVYIDDQPAIRCVQYGDTKIMEFSPLLVPNRNYKFVVWADVVTKDSGVEDWSNVGDNHYNTTNLEKITLLGDWNAMDESRDAFTGFAEEDNFACDHNVNIKLTRPFAKLRIVATDMDKTTAIPVRGEVRYTTLSCAGFNAVTGTAIQGTSLSGTTHDYTIKTYADSSDDNYILFTDYIFALDDDTIDLMFSFYEDGVSYPIMNRVFKAEDVEVKRNHITTIKGTFMTGDELVVGNEDITVTPWGDGGEVVIPGIVQ